MSRSACPIELRGESPGVREGGVIVQLVHDVELACPASAIPEKLAVNINQLALNASVKLSELDLPEGAKILAADLEALVVECVVPVEAAEEGAAGEAGAASRRSSARRTRRREEAEGK